MVWEYEISSCKTVRHFISARDLYSKGKSAASKIGITNQIRYIFLTNVIVCLLALSMNM